MHPEAAEINQKLQTENPIIYQLLSQRGKDIYFPTKGIPAQTAEAAKTAINATIGMAMEDDSSPMRLSSIAGNVHFPPADVFPYAPGYGTKELRLAWEKHIQELNLSLRGEISMPVVTAGITHALHVAGYLFVDKKDTVITSDLCWENYKLIFENACMGKMKTFPLFRKNVFNIRAFSKTLQKGKGKKIILFNFPNNPTGYSLTTPEAEEVVKIITARAEQGDNLVVLCDDAYIGFTYRPEVFRESLFSLLANRHPGILAVKIDGATKELFAWGLRIGFITFGGKGISPATYHMLEDKTAGVIRGSISNASRLSQSLLLEGLNSETYPKEREAHAQTLQQRFQAVQRILNEKKYAQYFTPLPCNSGYFICIALKTGLDAEKIRQTLLHKYSTGVISLGNLLRIAFSGVPEKNLKQLFENIYAVCRERE